jgi:predicted AAA+ superfamily ATPase
MGFDENPFSTKPAAQNDYLFGVEEDVKKIIGLIKDGQCCFIAGEYGSGKTTCLKKIINEFKEQGKLIYYSFSVANKTLDIDNLLVGRSGFMKKMLGIRSKRVILLLDEVGDMNLKDAKQVKNYYYDNFFSSVVFVGKELNNKIPQEVKDLVNENVFHFKGLSDKDAIRLVKGRLGGLKMISEEMVHKINLKSNNPRDLLKNLEDVFRYTIEHDIENVNEDSIKAVLG